MSTTSPKPANYTTASAEPDGAPLILGRPTLAGPVPKGLEKVFQTHGNPVVPEFCKLPPPLGRCPFTGASRTWLLEHGELGHFKLARIRKPGAVRGAVFVHVPSLLEFLRASMGGVE